MEWNSETSEQMRLVSGSSENVPLVSIIVPVYNTEQYLRRCIDSILAQNFSDFEVILIDDGSTDTSGNICDEYSYKDSRVKVIHQKNQGQAAARNCAVGIARGQWITFVDSDDIIHPQMIYELYHVVIRENAQISMCGCMENQQLPIDFFSLRNPVFHERKIDEVYLEELFHQDRYLYWAVWGKLINRQILLEYPFEKGRIYEDNAVICKWLVAAGKCVYTEEKLYFYYINSSGTTKSEFRLKQLDYLWALETQLMFYRKLQYTKMKVVVGTVYVQELLYFQSEVQKKLGDRKTARKLKHILMKFLITNKEEYNLNRQQVLSILDQIYPNMMKLYWRGIALLRKCKMGNK